jgi:hypothetical protein
MEVTSLFAGASILILLVGGTFSPVAQPVTLTRCGAILSEAMGSVETGGSPSQGQIGDVGRVDHDFPQILYETILVSLIRW